MTSDPTTGARKWDPQFLKGIKDSNLASRYALIILNQPFSKGLLQRVWNSSHWRCCADGGANHLYESFTDPKERELYGSPSVTSHHDADRKPIIPRYIPDAIVGDLDSIRPDVRQYYESLKVPVKHDPSEYATDAMKSVDALEAFERQTGTEHSLIFLGGLAGRLDQTIHTLSYLHKLRLQRKEVFALTDDNVGWVLDSGEHTIQIYHDLLGQTCGLLPVGIDSTNLSTKGLKWNLTDHPSSFDGLVSTSNHLLPEEEVVWIKTTKPIWWNAEIKKSVLEALE